MLVSRTLEKHIKEKLGKGRVIIIYGARRVGKTTLIKQLTAELDNVIYFNGDLLPDRQLWQNQTSLEYLHTIVKNYQYIVIDEAQNIPGIGRTLKILVDYFPDKQIIATGSSSFELFGQIDEPLTGRKWQFILYPFSYDELAQATGLWETHKKLNFFLTYGLYPEVVLNPTDAQDILLELVSSYLLKDILAWQGIKKSDKLITLLKALAFQIGQLISYNELANISGLDISTVEKYINLLEKSFVIFRLMPFSKNLRNELKRRRKIYFTDIGIRNAIINDFTDFSLRSDREKGAIWENFIISEMIKNNNNHRRNSSFYFWRTKDKAEIDLLEIKNNNIKAYEIKLKKKAKMPASFSIYNPEFHNITVDNFESFLLHNNH